jgi:hypothetical protein
MFYTLCKFHCVRSLMKENLLGKRSTFPSVSRLPSEGSSWNPASRNSKACSMYRVIKKSLCTWLLQYRKLQLMFIVSLSSLQTFIDTRLTLAPSVIPNSNYVIMVSDWNCLTYFCAFFCTEIIMCTETVWSPCMLEVPLLSVNRESKEPFRLYLGFHGRDIPKTSHCSL